MRLPELELRATPCWVYGINVCECVCLRVCTCVCVCKPCLLGETVNEQAQCSFSTTRADTHINTWSRESRHVLLSVRTSFTWKPAEEGYTCLAQQQLSSEGRAFTTLSKTGVSSLTVDVITPFFFFPFGLKHQTKLCFAFFLLSSFKFTLANYKWSGACKRKSDGLTSSLFIGQGFGNLLSCKITDFGSQRAWE